MPELPEVETVVRALQKSNIFNSKITKIEIFNQKQIKEIDFSEFIDNLLGRKIEKIERKGKWIMFFLEDLVLFSHLRMTGKYFLNNTNEKISLSFEFENGVKIFYCDPREFGVFYLRKKENYLTTKPYTDIGKDIFNEEIDRNYLFNWSKKSSLPIKSFLLEQKIISGIGNIYASEILFLAKINPFYKTKDLNLDEVEKIILISREMMKKAVEMNGTSVVDFVSPLIGKGSYQNELKVYMKEGKKCYFCKSLILMKKINNRSSFYCEVCQK